MSSIGQSPWQPLLPLAIMLAGKEGCELLGGIGQALPMSPLGQDGLLNPASRCGQGTKSEVGNMGLYS